MSSPTLSTKATEILAVLRDRAEGAPETDARGEWFSVYLDNARPRGMTAREFAGYLGALAVAGVYRTQGDDYFGLVLMATTAENETDDYGAPLATITAGEVSRCPIGDCGDCDTCRAEAEADEQAFDESDRRNADRSCFVDDYIDARRSRAEERS